MAKLNVERALRQAKVHQSRAEIEQARGLYNQILAAFPHNVRAKQGLEALQSPSPASNATQNPPQEQLNQLLALYNQGHLARVAEQAAVLTKSFPHSFVLWNILGTANLGLRRLDQAENGFRKASELNPNYAIAHNNMGNALWNQGKHDDAIAAYQRALAIKPDYAEAYNNMGNALRDLGRPGEAIAVYQRALAIKPDFAQAHNNLGAVLQEQGKPDEAIAAYRRALAIKPDYANALNNMGNALRDQGKLDDAIAAYQRALAIKPDYAEAYNSMGAALRELGRRDEAIAAYQRALAIRPNFTEAHNNIGNALRELGKHEEAIAAYQRALAIKPDYAEAHKNMGAALEDQGRLDDAIAAYQRALAIRPDYAACYRSFANVYRWQPADPHIAKLINLHAGCTVEEDLCHLNFALYKAHDKICEYEAAFNYLKEGNDIRRHQFKWHISGEENFFNSIKSHSHKLHHATSTSPYPLRSIPIFIVGMPRSGTSLVEQILSSNADIYGAGELDFVARFGSSLAQGIDINADNISRFRTRYLQQTSEKYPAHLYFTDKMPHNFRFLGLIMKALPEAKVVHVFRDPAATCWSNFETYFSNSGLEYAYNTDDIRKFYVLYRDLMQFWSEHFGKDIYHLDYEKLTSDPDEEIRRLVKTIGLPWDDCYLSPETNSRAVRTASAIQVRQPIYKGSSDYWRHYEPYLEGAFDNLQKFAFS